MDCQGGMLIFPGCALQSRINLPAPQLFDELLEEIRCYADESGFTDDVCLVGMELTAEPR